MRSRSLARLLTALSLGVLALTASAALIPFPNIPGTEELIRPEAIPQEIRESFSQGGVASYSQLVLAARSAALRDQVVQNPEDPYPLHALGTVTFHLGGEHEARVLWSNAAGRDPNLAPAEVMAAVHSVLALLETGETEQARQALAEAERSFEDQPHFQLIRAEQAMRSANLTEAQRAFVRAHELGPELYVTALNLGRFLEFVQASPDTVLPLYRKAVELAPQRSETWLHLAQMQARSGLEEEALASFRRLQSFLPDSRLPEWQIADLRLGAGDPAAAERWYRRALETSTTDHDGARIRAALGDALLRLGKTAQARKEVETALQVEETPPLLFALATLDEEDKRVVEAERGYRRILELLPGHPLAANNLAMLLIKQEQRTAEALSLAESAREAIPANAIIEGTYGCALSHEGHHEKAIEILRAVIAALDEDAWAHYCLGRSLSALGQADAAAAEFQRAHEIDPNFSKSPPFASGS